MKRHQWVSLSENRATTVADVDRSAADKAGGGVVDHILFIERTAGSPVG